MGFFMAQSLLGSFVFLFVSYKFGNRWISLISVCTMSVLCQYYAHDAYFIQHYNVPSLIKHENTTNID